MKASSGQLFQILAQDAQNPQKITSSLLWKRRLPNSTTISAAQHGSNVKPWHSTAVFFVQVEVLAFHLNVTTCITRRRGSSRDPASHQRSLAHSHIRSSPGETAANSFTEKDFKSSQPGKWCHWKMLRWQMAAFLLTKAEDETNVRTVNMILFCHALTGSHHQSPWLKWKRYQYNKHTTVNLDF